MINRRCSTLVTYYETRCVHTAYVLARGKNCGKRVCPSWRKSGTCFKYGIQLISLYLLCTKVYLETRTGDTLKRIGGNCNPTFVFYRLAYNQHFTYLSSLTLINSGSSFEHFSYINGHRGCRRQHFGGLAGSSISPLRCTFSSSISSLTNGIVLCSAFVEECKVSSTMHVTPILLAT